jgi:hypothetical protein
LEEAKREATEKVTELLTDEEAILKAKRLLLFHFPESVITREICQWFAAYTALCMVEGSIQEVTTIRQQAYVRTLEEKLKDNIHTDEVMRALGLVALDCANHQITLELYKKAIYTDSDSHLSPEELKIGGETHEETSERIKRQVEEQKRGNSNNPQTDNPQTDNPQTDWPEEFPEMTDNTK